jgi:acetyltransferase-like isoleucine patch superfamily enzyme/acyl carrier protein
VIGRMFAQVAAGALDGTRSALALRAATRRGARVRVFGWVQVFCEGELVIGNDVVFVSTPAPIALVVARGARLAIGDGALLESGVTIRASTRISIGARARIGAGSVLDDEGVESGDVEVGDDAWIEDEALLMSGASVGPRQVVPRGSIVRGHYEESPPTKRSPPTLPPPDTSLAVRATHRRIRSVIARVVPGAREVEPSVNLKLVKGWDSLAALRVLVALEKEFTVVLPHDLFTEETTLDRLLPFLTPSAGP